jgi:tetratricopeptide (TPR) repeat protein
MATTQMNSGQLYLTRGLYEKAETALKEAQNAYGRLVLGQPDVLPEYWQSLARSHAILGTVYHYQAQDEKAEAAHRHALAEKAEAAQQQALKIFEKLAKEHPDVQEYAYDVGRCFLALADTAARGGRPAAALARYDKAIEIMEGVLGKGYLAARDLLLKTRLNRAIALAGRGDHARATSEAEAVVRQGDLNAGNLYDVACVFSLSSTAADHDTKLSPADRTGLKARYADQAMDFLRRAIAKGWRNPRVMKTDSDLEPLRARKEFQKLLADLEGKTKE